MSSVNEKMTAIADEVRTLSGTTGKIGLDEMATNLESANNEIDSQSELLEQLVSALEDKASVSEPALQSKTVSPSTSKQTVTPDSSYDGLSSVVVNAIPSNYIVPSGTKMITTNGTHDVKSYASATVNVAGSGGNVETCTIVLTLDELLSQEGAHVTVSVTRYVDGSFIADYGGLSATPNYNTITIPNIVCGSALTISSATSTVFLLYASYCAPLIESERSLVIEVQVPPDGTDNVTIAS